jgi:hypothetical protein
VIDLILSTAKGGLPHLHVAATGSPTLNVGRFARIVCTFSPRRIASAYGSLKASVAGTMSDYIGCKTNQELDEWLKD